LGIKRDATYTYAGWSGGKVSIARRPSKTSSFNSVNSLLTSFFASDDGDGDGCAYDDDDDDDDDEDDVVVNAIYDCVDEPTCADEDDNAGDDGTDGCGGYCNDD
jgi:hypothetical protein